MFARAAHAMRRSCSVQILRGTGSALGLSGSAATVCSFSGSSENAAPWSNVDLKLATPPKDENAWNKMIQASMQAVVSIKVNRVRAFDTVGSGSVQATGFVVDKERGLILTNRHVAGPGPVVAEAIFVNNEEVPLQAVYYDPVNAAPAAAAPTHARAHRPHAGLGRRAGGSPGCRPHRRATRPAHPLAGLRPG